SGLDIDGYSARCGERDVGADVTVIREDPTVAAGGAVGLQGEGVAVNRDGGRDARSSEYERDRCDAGQDRKFVGAGNEHRTSIAGCYFDLGASFSRSLNSLLNFSTFGRTTNWQYCWFGFKL